MNKKIVALSYAHYPKKPGAGYDGTHEHELSIDWAETVKHHLQVAGISVIITPIGGLTNKVKFINDHDADVAVEIHFNGSSNPSVAGVETLYCPGSKNGKIFADIVHRHYAPEMNCRDRGVKEGWYKMDQPGVVDFPGDKDGDERKDYFLKATRCPSLIPEPNFVSQLKDIDDCMESACLAMSMGIIEYLER